MVHVLDFVQQLVQMVAGMVVRGVKIVAKTVVQPLAEVGAGKDVKALVINSANLTAYQNVLLHVQMFAAALALQVAPKHVQTTVKIIVIQRVLVVAVEAVVAGVVTVAAETAVVTVRELVKVVVVLAALAVVQVALSL